MAKYIVFTPNLNKPEEWSDWRCNQIASQDDFPDIVKDLNVQKNIINTYFNFYLSGKVPKGISVTDVIFATIAIMPVSCEKEELIWDENIHYSSNGTLFYVSSEQKLSKEINNIISKTSNILAEISINIKSEYNDCNSINDDHMQNNTDVDHNINKTETEQKPSSPMTKHSDSEEDASSAVSNSENQEDSEKSTSSNSNIANANIVWLTKKSQQNVKSNDSMQYTPEANAKFCAFVNNIINKWDEDVSARICLKYYFGLTCLILMRTITMSYNKVTYAFESSTYRNMERQIFCTTDFYNCHSVPDKKCIKKSFKAFRTSDNNIQIMFAKLVVNSRLQYFTRHGSGYVDIFRRGLLLHTAHFKMDLIKMFEEVACKYDFKILMDTLNVSELAESRERIYNFINKYMKNYDGNILHTCHWAPIIERHQFEELTCSNNLGFAVVIAVFKEKLYSGSSDIWKAKWVLRADSTQLQAYKQLGVKLYNQYNENYHFSPFSATLISKLQKYLHGESLDLSD